MIICARFARIKQHLDAPHVGEYFTAVERIKFLTGRNTGLYVCLMGRQHCRKKLVSARKSDKAQIKGIFSITAHRKRVNFEERLFDEETSLVLTKKYT